MSTPLLGLRGVRVQAGGRAILDIPHLDLAPATTTAVLGSNGAGKSTLLRVAGALLVPGAGALLLDGRPATRTQMRAVTAAVLQRPLLRRGTVARNAETGLRFHGVDRAQARARARGWLDRLGVGPLADRAAHTLSGGEAQRVSLARALAVGPRLLLLDEPFASLDSLTRGELLADLRAVLDETRTATLLVTHDHREAAALADRVAILDAGKLRQEGPVGDVLDNPADPASARVLGFENVVPGALWGLASPHVAVRAEDCTVAADGCGARATVRRVIPLGSTLRITAEADGHTVIATAPAAASAWLAAREGRQVVLGLDAARARAIRG